MADLAMFMKLGSKSQAVLSGQPGAEQGGGGMRANDGGEPPGAALARLLAGIGAGPAGEAGEAGKDRFAALIREQLGQVSDDLSARTAAVEPEVEAGRKAAGRLIEDLAELPQTLRDWLTDAPGRELSVQELRAALPPALRKATALLSDDQLKTELRALLGDLDRLDLDGVMPVDDGQLQDMLDEIDSALASLKTDDKAEAGTKGRTEDETPAKSAEREGAAALARAVMAVDAEAGADEEAHSDETKPARAAQGQGGPGTARDAALAARSTEPPRESSRGPLSAEVEDEILEDEGRVRRGGGDALSRQVVEMTEGRVRPSSDADVARRLEARPGRGGEPSPGGAVTAALGEDELEFEEDALSARMREALRENMGGERLARRERFSQAIEQAALAARQGGASAAERAAAAERERPAPPPLAADSPSALSATAGRDGETSGGARLPPIPVSINHPRFADNMGQRVTFMLNQQMQQARIQLNPANMGPVSIRIDVRGEEAVVQMMAAQGTTREALEASLPRLREMLADSGFNQVSVNVGQSGGQGAGNLAGGGPGAGEQDSSGSAEARAHGDQNDGQDGGEAETRVIETGIGQRRLDLFA